MSNEEYLLAFESILYGLIVSKILVKWSQLAKEKPEEIHWAYLLITINIFLLIVNIYWANRQPEHYDKVTNPLAFFAFVVIPPSLFTFMTYQLFPDKFTDINLKEYLIKNRRLIFIPWALYFAYEVLTLSTIKFSLYTVVTALILVLAVVIIKSTKQVWISTFILLHTLIIVFAYLRAILFG